MRVEQLWEWIQAGRTQPQMAADLGVTRQRVQQYLARHGLLNAYHERQAALRAERMATRLADWHKPRSCAYCHQPIDDRRLRLHPDCTTEKVRAYRREYHRVRRQTDPEYREQQRAYQQANAERIRAYYQAYYAANAERITEYQREYKRRRKAETGG